MKLQERIDAFNSKNIKKAIEHNNSFYRKATKEVIREECIYNPALPIDFPKENASLSFHLYFELSSHMKDGSPNENWFIESIECGVNMLGMVTQAIKCINSLKDHIGSSSYRKNEHWRSDIHSLHALRPADVIKYSNQ